MDGPWAEELLQRARELGEELLGLDPAEAVRELQSRQADFADALNWFFERDQACDGLQLTLALVDFWQSTGRITEARRHLERALSRWREEDAWRAEGLFQAGLLAFWQGDDQPARALHYRSLELARRIDDPTQIALALTGLARIELRSDVERARQLSQEALDAVAEVEEVRGRSNAFQVLGVAAQMAGDQSEARRWFSARLELAEHSGNMKLVAAEAANLSVVERQLGNLPRARELATDALTISQGRGDEWMLPYDLNGLAGIALAEGAPGRAVLILAAADRLMEEQATVSPPDELPHFEQSKAAAAEAIGKHRYERLWLVGRSISSCEAIVLALSDDDSHCADGP